MTTPPRIRCRVIQPSDNEALVGLLSRGFPAKTPAWWARAIARLKAHAAEAPTRTFGYVLEADGILVGTLLTIHSANVSEPRCNLSSWYVEPAYQVYASLLVAQATRSRLVTYTDLSPAPHTLPTIEAQGFVRYAAGRFLAVPALGRPDRPVTIRAFVPAAPPPDLPERERALLARHITYGCIALCAETPDGVRPFLFKRLRLKGVVPGATLIYCRDTADLVRCRGPLGRALLRRGVALVAVDANGPIAGLHGWFRTAAAARYYRGPARPPLGDLTDTEIPMFGL